MEEIGGIAEEARRRAMEAAGVDPDTAPAEPHSDEEEAAQQAWQADRKRARLHGEACLMCLGDVKLADEGTLREVTAWAESLSTDNGSIVVWRAEPTGRIVCPKCGEALTGPKQERLSV